MLFDNFLKSTFGTYFSIFILVCFTTLSLNSCVSFKIKRKTINNSLEKPTISMEMFYKKHSSDDEKLLFHGLRSTLSFNKNDDKGDFVKVASSKRGNWLLKNAPKGKYKIQLDNTIMVNGKREELKGKLFKTFTLKENQRAEIFVTLKKVPVGWIIVISVVVVALIIYLIFSRNNDFPNITGILPSPGHITDVPRFLPRAIPLPTHIFFPPGVNFVGRPPLFIDGGFYYSPNASPDRETIDAKQLPTEATSFYPSMNAKNVSPKTKIIVYFSKSLSNDIAQEPRIIRVIGSNSGQHKGKLVYVSSQRKLTFAPDTPFEANEKVTVTIIGGLIHDINGEILDSDYEWSFFISSLNIQISPDIKNKESNKKNLLPVI